MKIGPDRKLYYTIGDLGNNQLGNYCTPIEAQRLPTQGEIQAKNYAAYVGKALRLNLDGSIPNDNQRSQACGATPSPTAIAIRRESISARMARCTKRSTVRRQMTRSTF